MEASDAGGKKSGVVVLFQNSVMNSALRSVGCLNVLSSPAESLSQGSESSPCVMWSYRVAFERLKRGGHDMS